MATHGLRPGGGLPPSETPSAPGPAPRTGGPHPRGGAWATISSHAKCLVGGGLGERRRWPRARRGAGGGGAPCPPSGGNLAGWPWRELAGPRRGAGAEEEELQRKERVVLRWSGNCRLPKATNERQQQRSAPRAGGRVPLGRKPRAPGACHCKGAASRPIPTSKLQCPVPWQPRRWRWRSASFAAKCGCLPGGEAGICRGK